MPLPAGAEVAPSSRLFVLDEPTALAQALTQRLRDLGNSVRLVSPAEAWPSPNPGPADWIIFAPVGCPTPERFAPILGLLKSWRTSLAGGRLWLVQRLDGGFGLTNGPMPEPTQGAWAGLAKTLAHEWPNVRVQSIDLDSRLDAFAGAELLSTEWSQSGPVEVGLSNQGRFGVELRNLTAPDAALAGQLPSDGAFLLTGGARGITAAAALRLVQAGVKRLIIVGRTPESGAESPLLSRCGSEAELREALLKEGASGPREVRQRLSAILAERELRGNLALLRQAGAEVSYLAADLRDPAALSAQLRNLPETQVPVVGVIHGAGVLADRLLENLSDRDYAGVWETKVDGLRHVLSALDASALRWLVLFSSTTARLGRKGQAAYAMANEALNKLAHEYRRVLQQCRVLSFNWGPWAGGMVTPELARLFAQEGVGLIPQAAGVDLLLQEMLAEGPRPTEIVVLARPECSPAAPGPFRVRANEPWLKDHKLAGRPVVPLAVALSWCHAAASVLRPGEAPCGFADVALLKGLVLEGDDLEVDAEKKGDQLLLRARTAHQRWSPRLRATPLFNGQLHRLFPEARRRASELPPSYVTELFHGPSWQILEAVLACDPQGIVVCARPTSACTALGGLAWMLDAAFQSLIVFSQRQLLAPALPMGFDRLLWRAPLAAPSVRVSARLRSQAPAQFVADVEIEDHHATLLATLTGVRMIVDGGLRAAFHPSLRTAGQLSHA